MQLPCQKNPERFFDPELFPLAISDCARCPIKDQCALWGMDNEYGVFGGTVPYERGFEHEEDGREYIIGENDTNA